MKGVFEGCFPGSRLDAERADALERKHAVGGPRRSCRIFGRGDGLHAAAGAFELDDPFGESMPGGRTRVREVEEMHGLQVLSLEVKREERVGDGFFFTVGYDGLSGDELVVELMHYGVSCISLSTTGSRQQGVRGCCSRMREELYPLLEERMAEFEKDHPRK